MAGRTGIGWQGFLGPSAWPGTLVVLDVRHPFARCDVAAPLAAVVHKWTSRCLGVCARCCALRTACAHERQALEARQIAEEGQSSAI
eukprot:scaffold9218_cov115-Isochrysis_galbana.AAC.1